MSGINIKVELDTSKLVPQSKDVENAAHFAMETAVSEIKVQVAGGFDAGRTPGGSNWQPLSPQYAAEKQRRYGNLPILVLTGQLRQAAVNPTVDIQEGSGGGGDDKTQAQAGIVTATLTVTDPHAVIHEFGAGRVPARPFFDLEGDAAQKVSDKATEAFLKKLFG